MLSRPRVLILSFSNIANDPRILRHIAALAPIADVTTFGWGSAPHLSHAHIEIPASATHLPKGPAALGALASKRFQRAYDGIPAVAAVRGLAPDADTFDVIICNDANTAPVALDIAQGKPVIADLHEYAPRHFENDWRWRLTLQDFVGWICETSLPRMAATSTVAPVLAAEYARNYGIDPVVIRNAGPFRNYSPTPTADPIRLVHSGAASKARHLEVMIDAAANLPNVTLDLYLVTAPHNASYLTELRSRAELTPNVRIPDAVPMHAVVETLHHYDMGLSVLAPSTFNLENALPNKIFDFIQARLSIMVGPSPEMAAIVRGHDLGVVTSDFTAAALRAALQALSPDQVNNWKNNADAVARELNSMREAEELRAMFMKVAGA